MARKKDPNSVRQRAFNMLDNMTDAKRCDVINVLKSTFNIGHTYAATLQAAHRTINKENNTMTQVFSVCEVKDGNTVKPYIKVDNVFNTNSDDCLNVPAAKRKYKALQNAKITKSNGVTIKTYTIFDIWDGKMYEPHLNITPVANPKAGACFSSATAKAKYFKENRSKLSKEKIELVKQL